MAMLDPDAFNELERTAWREVAVPYAASFGALTTQAIEPMLDALGVTQDTRLLDLACGPGWLSAAAAMRGAWVLGSDLSPAMLAQARASYPHIEFKMASGAASGAVPSDDQRVVHVPQFV